MVCVCWRWKGSEKRSHSECVTCFCVCCCFSWEQLLFWPFQYQMKLRRTETTLWNWNTIKDILLQMMHWPLAEILVLSIIMVCLWKTPSLLFFDVSFWSRRFTGCCGQSSPTSWASAHILFWKINIPLQNKPMRLIPLFPVCLNVSQSILLSGSSYSCEECRRLLLWCTIVFESLFSLTDL